MKTQLTPRLIIIEGMPGAGKTSTAQFVKQWLDEHSITNHLFLEGDLHHPADFESVAYLDGDAYADLLARFPEQREVLDRHTTCRGEDYFTGFWLLKDAHPIPDALFSELAQRDIYELPDFALQSRLIRERWQDFTTSAQTGDAVYILECTLLQNPLTMTIIQHNLPQATSHTYLESLLEIIGPLHPAIVYLYQQDLDKSLQAIAKERPQTWHDGVGNYVSRGAYGRETGNHGFEGYITAAKERQVIELAFLRETSLTNTVIDVTERDWDAVHASVNDLLEQFFT